MNMIKANRFFRTLSMVHFAVVLIYCQIGTYAQAGRLDTTFGEQGFVHTGFKSSGDAAHATALQSDGKIVVVGTCASAFCVARYNPDGTLDLSFNRTGKVQTFASSGSSSAQGVAIQTDGKIVVVGAAGYSPNIPLEPGRSMFGVVRYNPDGSLDRSFHNDGRVTTTVSSNFDGATGVAIQPNGKIVVVGTSNYGHDLVVVRYSTDGSLDTTFDGDGKAAPIAQSVGYSVTIQPDGKIVIGGSNYINSYYDYDYAAFRYDQNGSLDTTFNNSGIARFHISSGNDYAMALALQNDGKIILGGPSGIVRFTSDGSPDNSFAKIGYAATVLKQNEQASGQGLAIQSDGRIVLAGSNYVSIAGEQKWGFAIERFNSDGSLDNSIDSSGNSIALFSYNAFGVGTAIQPDGRILVVGSTGGDFGIVKYTENGVLDTTFNGNGKVQSDIGTTGGFANAMLIQPDGKIVSAGSTSGSDAFGVVRYFPDGKLDTTFGTSGKVVTLVSEYSDVAQAIALQADGKLVAAGRMWGVRDSGIPVVRYNPDGSLDNGFGTEGKVITSVGAYQDEANAVSIQSDGKIVVAGLSRVSDNGPGRIALARFNSDGSLDTSFGTNGKVITANCNECIANSIQIQQDGKLVISGSTTSNHLSQIFVARYTTDGSLDNSFAGDGISIVQSGSASGIAYGLAIQDDGKILVTGSLQSISRGLDPVVVRFNSDGALDTTFSGTGTVSISISEYEDVSRSLVIQPDGKIVFGGFSGYSLHNAGEDADFFAVRLRTDGSIDHSWGEDGVASVDLIGRDYANAMGMDHFGRVLIVGDCHGKMGVARYTADNVAEFSVSGRVSDAFGNGVSKARVTITNAQGESRSVFTSSFGYYRFDSVAAGLEYTMTVVAKRRVFSPHLIMLDQNLSGIDFVESPANLEQK